MNFYFLYIYTQSKEIKKHIKGNIYERNSKIIISFFVYIFKSVNIM